MRVAETGIDASLSMTGQKSRIPNKFKKFLICFLFRELKENLKETHSTRIYIEREWNRNCAFIKKHKTIHIHNSKMEQNNKNR